MTNVNEYLRPSSVEEAWSMLEQGGRHAKLVGGGTDVVLYATPQTTTLIDVAGLRLDGIRRQPDELDIGAATTLTELIESPDVATLLAGTVTSMLRQVGSPLLRNLATAGGTLGSAHPWSDVIPLFTAIGATVTVFAGSERTVLLEDLIQDRPLLHRCVITRIHLPVSPHQAGAAFLKFAQTRFDVGCLNCACYAEAQGGIVQDARLVVGGAPSIAQRLPEAEARVRGSELSRDAIEHAAAIGSETVRVGDDRRATAEYRRTLVGVALRRGLTRIKRQWEEAV